MQLLIFLLTICFCIYFLIKLNNQILINIELQNTKLNTIINMSEKFVEKQIDFINKIINTSSLKAGVLGELILEKTLINSGLQKNIDFMLQKEIKISGKTIRPDCILNIGKNKLIIDSKASSINFEQDNNNFIKSIKENIKLLSNKQYHTIIPNSLNFVVMFIPFENIWIECINKDKEIQLLAKNNNILVATSYSLPFILNLILESISYINFAETINNNFTTINKNIVHLDNNFKKMNTIHSEIKKMEININNINNENKNILEKITTLLKQDIDKYAKNQDNN